MFAVCRHHNDAIHVVATLKFQDFGEMECTDHRSSGQAMESGT